MISARTTVKRRNPKKLILSSKKAQKLNLPNPPSIPSPLASQLTMLIITINVWSTGTQSWKIQRTFRWPSTKHLWIWITPRIISAIRTPRFTRGLCRCRTFSFSNSLELHHSRRSSSRMITAINRKQWMLNYRSRIKIYRNHLHQQSLLP